MGREGKREGRKKERESAVGQRGKAERKGRDEK